MTALPPNGQQPTDPAAAVAGLAREVEALRRRQGELDGLSGRLRDLARVVQTLANEVHTAKASTAPDEHAGVRSWLATPVGPDELRRALDELVEWVTAVFLRYADARRVLPECWLWHPDVVEELLWLMTAWQCAYAAETESVFPAADWHDRHRPGVVRRLPQLARHCSLEQHARTEPGEQPVMDPKTRDLIAQWWGGSDPRGPAPIPPADRLDERGEHDR